MENDIHIKYIIANEKDISWGLTVNSVGYQTIGKNEPYPPGNHPTRYLFSTDKGRILEEYQLLYIVGGKGQFSSAHQKTIDLKEGTIVLLFPGEWHNYKPNRNTGWNEYWIGFNGVNMDKRIENGFFQKEKPIFNVGIQEELVRIYKKAIETARVQPTGFQQMLAGLVNYILGFIYSLDRQASFEELKVGNAIDKAKLIMFENYATSIAPEEIAAEVCMSYSWFRRIFKQYTGFAPAQYIQALRIQKGKELLTNTLLTVQEISYEIGFENADHFSALFKRKSGMTPIEYRNFTQGKMI